MLYNAWLHLNLSFPYPKGWCCDRIWKSTRESETEEDPKNSGPFSNSS